jgi:D-alanine transaminase
MTMAYLNGEYLPLEQAYVPAMDRGYLFGDGVYEVIPIFNGRPFRMEHHLERLKRSLACIKLTVPLTNKKFKEIIGQLIKTCDFSPEQSIYLQITRGAAPFREHTFPAKAKPTIFAYCLPYTAKPINELMKGVSAITLPDVRWQRCDIKSINLLANILLRQEALEQGAAEAILIRDQMAVEGSSSNLFIVKDNMIITPPLNHLLLGGITRELVLELAGKHELKVAIRPIPTHELQEADEIWITSSTKEILPVVQLDHKPIGKGEAGPVWHKIIEYYQAYKRSLIQ